MERWKKRDPIPRPIPALEKFLRGAGLLEARDLEAIERDAAKEIEEAIAFAESSPWEPIEDLLRDVCAAPAAEGGTR